MRWLGVIVVVGCSQSSAPGVPPDAPVIIAPQSSRDAPLRDRVLSLVVEAPAGTIVRLFPSGDCSGPELLREDAASAREGLRVELVHGDNVFSAQAVSGEGRASACSLPVTMVVRFRLRGEFPAPVVSQVLPRNPSPERQVRLRGISTAGWSVSVWSLPGCQGSLLVKGGAAQFDGEGLALELPFNGALQVSLDPEKGEALSRCSEALRLTHDGNVPDVGEAFFFPRPPHPWNVGTIVVPGLRSGDRLEFFEGRDCRGRSMSSALQLRQHCAVPAACISFASPVVLEATPVVSLRAVNQLGGMSPCITLVHTPSLDPPTPSVVQRFGSTGASALVGAGTDMFPPWVSWVETCDLLINPVAVIHPQLHYYEAVEGPLWFARRDASGEVNCEPFPP